jgi:hypothetical protein
VGGRDRERRTTRGQGHHDAGGEDKEQGRKDKEFGVHFYNSTQKILDIDFIVGL